jgi:SOS-response transcriptional repressor LexA
MSSINDRISILVPMLSHNKNAFAKALGYNYNAVIENIVGKRQSKPGFEFLNALMKTFPQVNATWLLTGEGEIMTDSKKSNAVPAVHNEDATRAPLVSQFAHAGYLRGYCDPEFMDSQPVYFSTRKYDNGNYVAFEIRGDSMKDGTDLSICDGDTVLCKELPVEYWKEKIQTPKVYVIIHRSEGITCKEVTHHNLENGEITCHSWNPDPEYSDFKLNLAEVNQLFYLKEISRKSKS